MNKRKTTKEILEMLQTYYGSADVKSNLTELLEGVCYLSGGTSLVERCAKIATARFNDVV